MKDIKALIIDDEASSRNVLKQLLMRFCPEITVCGEASNSDIAYELILSTQPQLVFLDIQMPSGNGFSLLRKFEKIDFEIVFVTSFDQFAIEAIKFNALDYLLKPVEVADLKAAVKKTVNRINEKHFSSPLVVNLLANLRQETQEKKIPLHSSNNVRFVSIGDIIFFEADGNYTNIETGMGEKFISSKNLKEFEEMLEGITQFIRVNKSVIVNINKIASYSKAEPYILVVGKNKEFEISRRKRNEVLERLKNK
ncbi:MAG: response regulator transcription factor [Bacteroidetes bacterium]|nr:response regulator transcription factor [Bacteroidota bacterium]